MALDNSGSQGLGTFAGVFTPSVLTILGLILFLRLGFVVGNVGLLSSLLLLVLATTVSVLTSLSLATAASNLQIKGGGVYFLISRTLGIEFGGAVGLVLYAAMSISIAFYCIGFAEVVVPYIDSTLSAGILTRLVATGLVLLLFCFAWLGSDWATRLQYLVMGLLVLALVSFFAGALPGLSLSTAGTNLGSPNGGLDFWTTFAVFFPAVTGFTQGVAMSGDLKTPSRSIVTGTFAAIAVSTAIYFGAMVVLAGSASAQVLRFETSNIVAQLSVYGWTAEAGVIAATVSSAMASLLGAPRVLQRIAEDRIVPPLESFGAGSGPMNNPRRATAASAAIALGTIAAGDINTVAPIITMFFLASYGLINYATYFEARGASTSFRPRFRQYDPRVSLAGAILCTVVVIAINPLAGAVAALVLWGIHNYLQRQEVPERWSDSVRAHHYSQARRHVLALKQEYDSERDWRPCMLVFIPNDSTVRQRVLVVASWLGGEAGFTTAVRVIEGSGPIARRRTREVAAGLEKELAKAKLPVFGRTVLAADLRAGVQAIVQSHGVGDIRPNTVVFGRNDLSNPDKQERDRFGEILQECARFSTNVIIVHCAEHHWERVEKTPPNERKISIWWAEDQAGQLMTLMAWLCTRSPEWIQATIEVIVPTTTTSTRNPIDVATILKNARIDANVIAAEPDVDVIEEKMSSATMALLPLRLRRNETLGPLDTPIDRFGADLPVTVFVLASEQLDIEAEPDDGDLARHAEAVKEASQAWLRVQELDDEASRLLVEAEIRRLELDSLDKEANPIQAKELAEIASRAETEATKAFRRYADWRTRAQERQAQADALDPTIDGPLINTAAWKANAARRETPNGVVGRSKT